MTAWLAVLAVTALFVALCLRIAWWLSALAEAEFFLEPAREGRCTCTRHRLCPVCLEQLRSEREAA